MTPEAVGHYRTTAGALAFMAVVGFLVGAIDTWALPQNLGFIKSDAIFGFSALYLGVAAWMATRQPDPATA